MTRLNSLIKVENFFLKIRSEPDICTINCNLFVQAGIHTDLKFRSIPVLNTCLNEGKAWNKSNFNIPDSGTKEVLVNCIIVV